MPGSLLSCAAENSKVDMEDRKRKRAERFGAASAGAPATAEAGEAAERKRKRAERFGLPVA